MEIQRSEEIALLEERLEHNPVVALLGPRQCGKTTLSQQFLRKWKGNAHIFDCEDPADLNRLEDPLTALKGLKGVVVIDEIQRRPDLFPVLRVLADQEPKTKYLILGSASRDLIRQSSESLAGRISYLEIGGFGVKHIPEGRIERLWIRGGFPRSFLAASEAASVQWRLDFIATFLERDIPNLGLVIPSRSLNRFWSMLAHYHGQIFNASEIGRSLGMSDHSAQRYLDLLTGTFMVRQLRPWFYNTSKRIIKRPKIYFRDSGILHALLSLEDKSSVLSHPKLGASWEGFALENVIEYLHLRENEVFFWGVHTGAEIDLVFKRRGKFFGVEVKYTMAPSVTPSIRAAVEELHLARVWVVYPGRDKYSLADNVTAMPISETEAIL